MNQKSNNINICLSCDENYAKHAGVVIASILANADFRDNIHIYILDGNISKESKEKILSLKYIKDCDIEFVQINEEDFEEYKLVNTPQYISIAACYRLKIATLLPHIKKIIYLDSDIIVCGSLRSLFDISLGENVIGGVLDIDLPIRRESKYVNSGVLLMDLDKIRTQNIERQLLNYTRENIDNIEMGDQEIINAVLADNILTIDSKYNVQSECFIRRSSFTKNPVIVHFIGSKKPWHFGSWTVHKGLYFKYLQFTPWKISNKELLKWTLVNNLYSLYRYFCHRPFFFLQGKFWYAVYKIMFQSDKESTIAIY